MTNKKRKGFTIVELVIVIAVIAILAGVLIPTFASIIDKANQSADIQAVRQMNVLLKAESVDKTLEFNDVIEIVSEAGYDTVEKRTPKSSGHGFYWHIDTNTIVLVKDPANEQAELIYPLDNEELTAAFDTLKASWTTNDHTGFKDLAVEGGSTGEEPTDVSAANIIDALKKGGNLKLTENVTISLYNATEGIEITDGTVLVTEAVAIPSGINTSLDLNGCILTLDDNVEFENYCDVISVSGIFTIKDTSTSSNGKIAITAPVDSKSYYNDKAAICVNEGGELNLSGVNVQGSGYRNIMNKGTLNLYEGTSFTITEDGYDGIENRGAATITGANFTVCSNASGFVNKSEDDDEVTITGGSFTASNPNPEKGLIYVESGSMTIDGTQFFDSISNVNSQIDMIFWKSDGTLTLTNAKFNDSDDTETNTYGDGVDARKGTVIINGGTYNCALKFCDTAIVNITGGTFGGLVSCAGLQNEEKYSTIDGGTFNGEFICTNGGEVTISGGTFTNTINCTGQDCKINIEDGTFTNVDEEDNLFTIVSCKLGSGNYGAIINITGGEFKGKLEVNMSNGNDCKSRIYISGDTTLYNNGFVSWNELPNNGGAVATGTAISTLTNGVISAGTPGYYKMGSNMLVIANATPPTE